MRQEQISSQEINTYFPVSTVVAPSFSIFQRSAFNQLHQNNVILTFSGVGVVFLLSDDICARRLRSPNTSKMNYDLGGQPPRYLSPSDFPASVTCAK